MNRDATHFSQVFGGPPLVIGYDERGPRQEGFNFGWNSALGRIFELERMAVAESIIAELGMTFGSAE